MHRSLYLDPQIRDELYIRTRAYFMNEMIIPLGSSFALSTAGFPSSSSQETWYI